MPLMNSKTINSKTLKMEFKKNCQKWSSVKIEQRCWKWKNWNFSKPTQNIGMNGLRENIKSAEKILFCRNRGILCFGGS